MTCNQFQMPFHTMIMYPTNSTALVLGRRLISNDHNISFYSPLDVHKRLAHTSPVDLEIAAMGMGVAINQVEDLKSLKEVDFLIYPTLDLDHLEKREDYAKMCLDLFR